MSIIDASEQLVIKGSYHRHLGMVVIILLDTILIYQFVVFFVKANALSNKDSCAENGANQVRCVFVQFFFAELLFEHTFGMI